MNKYYFVFPLLYCLIMLALLLHYISTEQETKFTWGQLSLVVRNQTKLTRVGSSQLPAEGIAAQDAKIQLGKIQFSFNNVTSIIADNTKLLLFKILPLASQSGFSLLFGSPHTQDQSKGPSESIQNSHTVTMTFQVNEIFKDEIIASIHSQSRHTSISFRAPFDTRAAKSAKTISKNTIQVLSISGTKDNQYTIRILGQGQFKKSKGRWNIITQSKYAVVRYGNVQSNGFQTLDRIPAISNQKQNNSKRAIQEYIDKAYRGWMQTRYDDKTATYLHPDGVYGFSEQALVASFAESHKHGEFISNRLTFNRIAHLYRNARTWRSAVLRFENPSEITQYMRDIQNTQRNVRQAIQEKNYAILLNSELVAMAHAFFDTRVQRKFLSFISTIPSSALSPEIAASLLIQYSISSWMEFKESIEEKKTVLEQLILENITVANTGYLLRQSPNELSVFYSVLAGYYFANFGTTNPIKNMGHRMIITALSLSDEVGFLPRIYVLKNKTTFSLGFITPEMLYHVLVRNPYYPQIKDSAYNTKTISPSIVPQNNSASLTILATAPHTTTFTTKRIHIDIEIPHMETPQYLFVLHVPPPKNIYAFNTMWSGKYFINKTSRAVYYDSQNNIALIKINSKNKQERVSFLY